MDPTADGGIASTEAPTTDPEVDSVEGLSTDTGEVDGADADVVAPEDLHTIKINGEEVQVPYDELVNGYSRQADYTRKAQELAAEREELATVRAIQTALEKDPKATLEALAQVYGITAQDPVENEDLSDLDPTEREIRELKLWRQEQESKAREQEQRARQQEVLASASQAMAQHSIDGTPEDLLKFAVENEIGNLDVAARFYKVEKAKSAEREQTVQRKRAAAVVEGGGGKAPGGVQAPKPKNVREAFRLAMQQHQVENLSEVL